MPNQIHVRMATEKDMDRIKEIWLYAFTDSTPFVDWYFDHYAKVEEIVVAELAGEVTASLQLIEENIVVDQKVLSARYIVGIDCLPEGRGHGLTRAMMTYTFDVYARTHPVDVFLLMPFEASFYYPYGFVFGTYHARMTLPAASFATAGKPTGTFRRMSAERGGSPICVQQLNDLYTLWQTNQSKFYLLRDDRQWRAILGDLQLENGYVVIWCDDEGMQQGYLLYHLAEGTLQVREMGYSGFKARQALYYYLASHRSQSGTVVWSAPLDEWMIGHRPADKTGVSLYPFMMYRINQVETIAHFAQTLPKKDYYFYLEEDPGQNYCWHKNSRCITKDEEKKPNALAFQREELTQMVFAPHLFQQMPNVEYDGEKRAIGSLFGVPNNYVNTYF